MPFSSQFGFKLNNALKNRLVRLWLKDRTK